MMFTKLCILIMMLQGTTALRLQQGAPPEFQGENICTGKHVQQLMQDRGIDKKMPKVAWIIAEKLDRFPLRHTERMRRLEQPLEGADVFIAAEVDDMNAVQYLPKPTRVGIFNYSFKSWNGALKNFDFHNDHPYLNVDDGAVFQFVRMQDALNLIREQEEKQGWKYDIIFRMRSEMIVKDICVLGVNGGCAGRGALLRLIAAEAKNKEIVHMGDWYIMGPRDEMMNATQELQSPWENQGFKVSCETDKDKGWEDVRQCALESNKQGQKKVQYLSSNDPRHPLSLEKKPKSFLEEGHTSEAQCCGHEESHVFDSIQRLGYRNVWSGKGLSSGAVFLRRFQNDYAGEEIGDSHDAQKGCKAGVYPPVGDA